MTSSTSAVSSSITMRIGTPTCISFSTCFIPIKENTKVTFEDVVGIVNLKPPCESVAVPTEVPFNRIVTPGNGVESRSTTVPCKMADFLSSSGRTRITMVLFTNS